tara:strand:- start:512 stop:919 length:408 start_codon:yes stop_codon:yes gene_type:complete
MNKPMKIIFFDGVCSFCNSTVDFIWKNNKKRNLYYSSLQSDFSKKELLKKGIDDFDLNTIYYDDGFSLYKKSEAVFRILKNLDGLYPIIGNIGLLFPKVIANFFYDIIAKYRYRIMGKRKLCRVPSIDERKYFID